MRRRDFIKVFVGSAAAWPLVARAQQPVRVVGFLSSRSSNEANYAVIAFRRGLQETGFVEGQNLTVEYRWADGNYDRLQQLASDLVSRRVAVIVATGSTVSGLAAKRATSTIPIIFLSGDDPVRSGLVASLNKPGGNATGVGITARELTPKRVDILHGLIPKADFGFLINPRNPDFQVQLDDMAAATNAIGRRLHVMNAVTDNDIEAAFATLISKQPAGILTANDPYFLGKRNLIIALAERHRIPAMYHLKEFASAGGLMSYGSNLADAYRQVGGYTGQILKGSKPESLPVALPTRFELVINRKAAKTLDLTIPDKLLALADEVIE